MVFEGIGKAEFLICIQLIVLLTGGLAITLLPAKFKSIAAIISVSLISILASTLAIFALTHQSIEILVHAGSFIGIVPIRIDALSAWFMLIISFVTLTGVFYGAGYLKSYHPISALSSLHWLFFLLFQSSMLWVCMVQNGIAFILVWEIMSISSLFLVVFDHTNSRVIKAGINYMVQMHLSVVFLSIGFIWVYFKTGSWDFNAIQTYFSLYPNIGLFIIFFIGFGIKAGFIGLHTWLPHAHPAAPSHVSGVMSGVIVKLGIFGIFRMISFLSSDFLILGVMLIVLSLITGLFGIMNASIHRDFKKLLAYCTIENIGIIGIGMGLGLIGIARNQSILYFLGFGGALLHVLNHSLFKSLLFYSSGSVYQQTHTRDANKLGGLLKLMPQTGSLFLIASIAIAGIPPLNGFISEFLIYFGLLKGIQFPGLAQSTLMIVSLAGLSIIGGISVLTFTKTFSVIFLGTARQELPHKVHEVSSLMLFPQYLSLAAMLLVAFFPIWFLKIPLAILNGHFATGFTLEISEFLGYTSLLKNVSLYSLLFIGIVLVVLGIRYLLNRSKLVQTDATWGCAYPAAKPDMQYTGKSYTKTFSRLFSFLLLEKKEYKELTVSEVFPSKRKYSSHYTDIFENKLIDPFNKFLNRFINLFTFIQNGRIQTYVIYGIVFILAVLVVSFINVWR